MSDRHFTLEELSAYLDGELDLEPRQQEHLKGCPECTRVFEGQRALRRMARDAAPQIPTDQMWTAIKAKIGEEIKQQMAATGGKKHDPTGRTAKTPKARSPKPGGFRWGPGAWLGFSSALATAGVLLIIRPAVDESKGSGNLQPKEPAYLGGTAAQPSPTGPRDSARVPPREPAQQPKPVESVRRADTAKSSSARAAESKKRPATKKPETVRSPSPEPARADAAPSAADAEQPVAAATAPVAAESAAPTRERSESRTRAAAAPSAAPASAMGIAAFSAPTRPVYNAKAFILTADRIDTMDPDTITASGRVVVRPAVSGSSYVATIDGITRTLTGEATGASAGIVNPGQRLMLYTTPR